MIEAKILDGNAYLYTPYNPKFITAIKKIGGARWISSERAWMIPEYALDEARKAMMECFGECDLPSSSPKVTVRLSFSKRVSEECGPIIIMGKRVASAMDRDSGAVVCRDAIFTQGAPESGGSRNHWETIIPRGSEVILYDVPSAILGDPLPDGVAFEVVGESKPDRTALLREREQLLARLAEIDKELGGGVNHEG